MVTLGMKNESWTVNGLTAYKLLEDYSEVCLFPPLGPPTLSLIIKRRSSGGTETTLGEMQAYEASPKRLTVNADIPATNALLVEVHCYISALSSGGSGSHFIAKYISAQLGITHLNYIDVNATFSMFSVQATFTLNSAPPLYYRHNDTNYRLNLVPNDANPGVRIRVDGVTWRIMDVAVGGPSASHVRVQVGGATRALQLYM
ncbi:MAG: hypothetical protein ACFCUE_08890 [Candidatus Bathyarchaeia archaeon]|jgi:hypothetical protein